MSISPLINTSRFQFFTNSEENKEIHPISKKSKEILNSSPSSSRNLSRQITPKKNFESDSKISSETSDILQIKKASQLEKAVSDKDAGYWKCTGRRRDEDSGGYLYEFRLKSEYGEMSGEEQRRFSATLKNAMFPAIQQYPTTLQISIEDSPLLQAVGFDCSRFLEERSLILPDAAILDYRWNKLRENDSMLPKLEFVELHGTVDDQTFVRIFSDGKISISDDEEFIHDLSIHVVAAICFFENSKDLYQAYMKIFHTMVEGLSEALVLLEQAPDSVSQLDAQTKKQFCQMLWTGLGMTVDNFTAQSNFLSCLGILKNLSKFLELQWQPDNDDPWYSYMQKRYDVAFEKNQKSLQNMWQYLVESVAQSSFVNKSSFNAESAWKVIE